MRLFKQYGLHVCNIICGTKAAHARTVWLKIAQLHFLSFDMRYKGDIQILNPRYLICNYIDDVMKYANLCAWIIRIHRNELVCQV